MRAILVPYHIDEPRPDLDVPAEPRTTVTAELPPGDPWRRIAPLYDRLAGAVARTVRTTPVEDEVARVEGGAAPVERGAAPVERDAAPVTGVPVVPVEGEAGRAAIPVVPVEGEAGRAAIPVVMSGDCMASLGTVAGLGRAGIDPVVVWLDAHGDLNTPEGSPSGYLGGMPLRLLVGHRPELVAGRLGLRAVPEEKVVLVGARDLDPPEEAYLAGAGIGRATVADLDADRIPAGPIYLHVDFDVVDPADLPGLLYPTPGGPRLPAVAAALRRVMDTGRVAAIGLACTWRPGHGAAERVRPHVAELLRRGR